MCGNANLMEWISKCVIFNYFDLTDSILTNQEFNENS